MTGQIVSRYEVLEKLGEGGMGQVYKARDSHLERFVALKFLPADRVSDEDRRRRFIQEARTASALNHPNIVAVYDIDEAAGLYFIAMEYVPGKALDALIPRKGMRLGEALKIAIQVADALAKAHAAGVVHRDLKPGNVMVTPEGLVKVLDFGLAKLMEARLEPQGDRSTTVTAEGMIVGTAGYMSPEQAEGSPADSRSDIFSFGCLLYEMLTGERAFRGDTPMSTIAAILREDPKPPSAIVAGIPRDAEKIVRRCLRKDPARRFQTMADLKVALMELKEDSESGEFLPPQRALKPRNRRRAAIWAGIAAIVVLAAAGTWYAFRRDSRPLPPMRTLHLTSFPGVEQDPALSPDGNLVAFTWSGPNQDNQDIWVQQIGAGNPIRLTTDAAPDSSPAWSPDGRQIVFCRRTEGMSYGLFVMPALGGGERKLAEVRTPLCMPSWSPDSKGIVIGHRESPDDAPGLRLLSVETGQMRRLTSVPRESRMGVDLAGRISPDGSTLLFIRTPMMNAGDLYTLALDRGYVPDGDLRRLTSDSTSFRGATWLPDSRTVVFGADRTGSPALWRLDTAAGGQPELVPNAGDDTDSPAASLQGNRLAFVKRTEDMNIWRLDLKTGKASQAIASTLNESAPAFSPDGSRVAFASDRSGRLEIWVSDPDGSRAVQLTDTKQGAVMPRWSPDGKRIAYGAPDAGRWATFVIDADGGVPVRLEVNEGAFGVGGWSSDGRWLYYGAKEGIFKLPVNGGAAVQLSKDRGFRPVESADGRYVYYSTGGRMRQPGAGASIRRLPLAGGEPEDVLPATADPNQWAIASNGIYYAGEAERGRYAVRFYDFASRSIRLLTELPKPLGQGFSIAPDGRSLLYTQIDQEDSDILMIENFR